MDADDAAPAHGVVVVLDAGHALRVLAHVDDALPRVGRDGDVLEHAGERPRRLAHLDRPVSGAPGPARRVLSPLGEPREQHLRDAGRVQTGCRGEGEAADSAHGDWPPTRANRGAIACSAAGSAFDPTEGIGAHPPLPNPYPPRAAVMPGAGFEPARLSAAGFKPAASASSATRAPADDRRRTGGGRTVDGPLAPYICTTYVRRIERHHQAATPIVLDVTCSTERPSRSSFDPASTERRRRSMLTG